MNRTELQESYIQQLIEGMDYKTMERFVYDTLEENLTNYTDEELTEEVKEYYPELLEGWRSDNWHIGGWPHPQSVPYWSHQRGWSIPLKTLHFPIIHFDFIMSQFTFTSSAIENISDVQDGKVTITFNGGRDYTYGVQDVEQFVSQLSTVIASQQSVGRFVNNAIKSEQLVAAWWYNTGRRQPLPFHYQPQRTMDFFDTEDFSLFDLVDECQPYEELSPEARRMLNQVEYYDDYTQGSTIDHDYGWSRLDHHNNLVEIIHLISTRYTHKYLEILFFNMENRSLLISMLRKGENGEEILQILETITSSDGAGEPTLEPIDFWYHGNRIRHACI